MGQRVTFTLTKGEKELANAYYHWSGYTISSVEILENIVGFFENEDLKPQEDWTETDYLTYAINALQSTGAKFPHEEGSDRSDGLIAILDDCEANKNFEANIYIDLETKEIKQLNEILLIEDYSSYNDWRETLLGDKGEVFLPEWDNLPTLNTSLPNIFCISFDDFKWWECEVIRTIFENPEVWFVWEDYAISLFA